MPIAQSDNDKLKWVHEHKSRHMKLLMLMAALPPVSSLTRGRRCCHRLRVVADAAVYVDSSRHLDQDIGDERDGDDDAAD